MPKRFSVALSLWFSGVFGLKEKLDFICSAGFFQVWDLSSLSWFFVKLCQWSFRAFWFDKRDLHALFCGS